jgi:hypothetical protein
MIKFIEENDLIKRQGYDEWYNRDNKVRVVKQGDRYRMDVRISPSWSKFYCYWIIGPRTREFVAVSGHRRR